MERARDVVLIRHGETSWSASGKHTGRTDVPLTERGRRQAADLGATVAGWRFALALTSPLQRAAETARLAGLSCTAEDDLQEWDYGELEGLTTPEIREDLPGWTIWRGPVPGGEGVAEVAARVDRVIERVQAVDVTWSWSPTATCCGPWPPAGWSGPPSRGGASSSTRRPWASSAPSEARRRSCAGTCHRRPRDR